MNIEKNIPAPTVSKGQKETAASAVQPAEQPKNQNAVPGVTVPATLSSAPVMPDPLADVQSQAQEGDQLNAYFDSTSLPGISLHDNAGYSEQLIKEANDAFDLERLTALSKDKDHTTLFLEESEMVIKKIEHCRASLAVHDGKYDVQMLYKQGLVLENVEKKLGNKTAFTQWRDKSFPHEHIRSLQYARQLAGMGDFVLEHSAIGRDNLLALDSLRNKNAIPHKLSDLSKAHPFPDMKDDPDGKRFREHAESIITLYRLKGKKIEATFDEAKLITLIKGGALKVKDVEALNKYLDSTKDKAAAFEKYLLDKCFIPKQEKEKKGSDTIESLLAAFLSNCTEEQLADSSWLNQQTSPSLQDTLTKTHNLLQAIAYKLEITLDGKPEIKTA